jgi:hypothetical protein
MRTFWSKEGLWSGDLPEATVLRFSAGQQSTCILLRYLLDEEETPKNFFVTCADPGMEDSRTVAHRDRLRDMCAKKGVPFILAPGPSLYEDLLDLDKPGIQNPPYWTKNPKTGAVGRLRQCCTLFYKIKPMERATRAHLHEVFGVRRGPGRVLRKGWLSVQLGMSADETQRVSTPRQDYSLHEYPLMDWNMTKADVLAWFAARGIAPPPRSVCQACFSNAPSYYREMRDTRPEDFEKAVAVDEAVRDFRRAKVSAEVFVSKTLIPLRELPDVADDVDDDLGCDSGYCFV